jgi:hypothetical protein
MWVVTKARIGAATITLEASSLKFKVRRIVKMREYPRKAAADEKYSFSVQVVSLQQTPDLGQ